ncbi:MAG: Lrp/AsnC family transcriptional regulator [Candidatus Bathyarchaeota archaeon]|nr:MAG: Lrp/AsnC family transcriptional regulator [Candidatus Bathyarchaeota archaeon]
MQKTVNVLFFLKVRNMKIKNQAVVLDNLDWKILQVLQENARQTYTEIGRLLGVAHSTIYDRIRTMEKHDIIKKYTAVIDLENIGIKHVTAVMTVFTNPQESEKVAKRLSESKEVLEVSASLSENLSIIAKVVAEDQNRLHLFIAQSVAPLPGVLRVRTSIITRKYKDESFSIENWKTVSKR